jgi:hypothetical protein
MTPDEASDVVDALGNAFALGDVGAVIEMFTDEGEVMYAGSEQGEVAVGLPALRLLLADLFSRDERYSWRCDSVHITACAEGIAVLADATLFVDPWPGRPDGSGREIFPYRVSGVLEEQGGSWRWRLCHASEPSSPTT